MHRQYPVHTDQPVLGRPRSIHSAAVRVSPCLGKQSSHTFLSCTVIQIRGSLDTAIGTTPPAELTNESVSTTRRRVIALSRAPIPAFSLCISAMIRSEARPSDCCRLALFLISDNAPVMIAVTDAMYPSKSTATSPRTWSSFAATCSSASSSTSERNLCDSSTRSWRTCRSIQSCSSAAISAGSSSARSKISAGVTSPRAWRILSSSSAWMRSTASRCF